MFLRRALLAVSCGLAACARGGAGPESDPARGYGGIPDLEGRSVLLLPAQSVAPGMGAPDAELAFAADESPGRIRWIPPRELRQALSRSPGVPSDPDRLPVGIFFRGEVRRVGDPLYGDLRRLAALVAAEVAAIPLEVRRSGTVDGGEGSVEIAATLVDIRSGRVFWYGVVRGEPGPPGSPEALATAAAALIRRIDRR